MALNFPEEAINNRVAKIGVSAYLSTPVDTVISVAGTYQRLEGIFTNNLLEGFIINDDDKLEYAPEDGVSRTFAVVLSISFKSNTVNTTAKFGIETGDGTLAIIDGSEITIRTTTAGVYVNGTIIATVLLEDGDTIEILVKADKIATLTPEKVSPILFKMF